MGTLSSVVTLGFFIALSLMLCDVVILMFYFLSKRKLRDVLSQYGSVVLLDSQGLALRKDPASAFILGKYLLFREYNNEKEEKLIKVAGKARSYLKYYLILLSIWAPIFVSCLVITDVIGL